MMFENATDEDWYFAVYKKFPESPGLSSIALQVRPLGKQLGSSPPPTAEVNWTMEYGLCIADFDKDQPNIYTGQQFASGQLGKRYQVISDEGIPTISPFSVGDTGVAQMTLQNNTSNPVTPVTMGFTMSKNIVVVEKNVGGKQTSIFRVHPTYYVACYHKIVLGQDVDMGVAIGPLEVEYTPGNFSITVQAYKTTSGNYTLIQKTKPE